MNSITTVLKIAPIRIYLQEPRNHLALLRIGIANR